MTNDAAKRQGIFLPNWWLSMLLVPVAIWVYWMSATVRDIAKDQATAKEVSAANSQTQVVVIQGLKDTLEYRLKSMETQGKLNDEHLRQIENRIARIEGKKNISVGSDQ